MFILPKLPFKLNALEPTLSRDTIFYHYKIHRSYVNKLNELVKGTRFANDTETTIKNIIESVGPGTPLYQNAAQHINHCFYWQSISSEKTSPDDFFKAHIKTSYGSFITFKDAFIETGTNHFASGWLWIVINKYGMLDIIDTPDAFIPEGKLLLNIDIFEHAFFLDYKNDKSKYLKNAFNILNWKFAESNSPVILEHKE